MSLPGRLYDLKKAIDTGSPYRSGDLSGTQYIVLGQSLIKPPPKGGESEEKKNRRIRENSGAASGDGNEAVGLGIGVAVLAAALFFATSSPTLFPRPARVIAPPVSSVRLPASYNPQTDAASPAVKITPPPVNAGAGLSEADATSEQREASRRAQAVSEAQARSQA